MLKGSQEQGKHEEAESKFKETIASLEGNGHENLELSYELFLIMINFGQMLKSQKREKEAQRHEARAQIIREKRLQKAEKALRGQANPRRFFIVLNSDI